jgi:predicted TIM-barrel fold metal-dependent hydrolase
VKIVQGMKSLDARQRQQVLWGNAARLLRLDNE